MRNVPRLFPICCRFFCMKNPVLLYIIVLTGAWCVTITVQPNDRSTSFARIGSNVTIRLNDSSTANLTLLQWMNPNNTITPFTLGNNSPSHLELVNVSLYDSGLYYYRAFSLVGPKFNGSVELIVQDTPDPPVNLTLESGSATSLNLSWTFGNNHNSPITLHTVYVYNGENLSQQYNVSAPIGFKNIVGLQPDRCYHIVARALNDVGWSVITQPVHAITTNTRPAVKPLITVRNVSQHTIVLRAERAEFTDRLILSAASNVQECGDADSRMRAWMLSTLSQYAIYVSTVSPQRLVQKRTEHIVHGAHQLLEIKNLQPYTNYNISVAYKNENYHGPITQLLNRTAEGVPNPPVVVHISSNSSSLTIRWENGASSGGVIRSYKLELYRCGALQRTDFNESLRLRKQQVGTTLRQFTFGELDPNACYEIRVAASTRVGFGPFSMGNQTHTDISTPRPPQLLSASFVRSNDILLNWTCSGSCSASRMGTVHYTVCWIIPIQNDGDDTFSAPSAFSSPSSRLEPNCIRTQTFNPALQAFCNCGTMQKYQTTVLPGSIVQGYKSRLALFTVRSVRKRSVCQHGQACEKESLDSNNVVLDLKNAPDSWSTSMLSAIILLVLMLFSFLVVLIVCFTSRLKLVFFWCQRSMLYRSSYPSHRTGYRGLRGRGRASLNGKIPAGKFSRTTPLRLTKTTQIQPIVRSELRARVAAAHADSDAGFQAEFEAIELAVSNSEWTTNMAKMPENLVKNRYSNVLAYDHTRVILKEAGRKSDYINANYIDGYHRLAAYIAAQGPIPATFDDFWLMVWEQECNVIVMISNFIERGRRKCDKYWPSMGQQLYGLISVRMISETVYAFHIVRVFLVRHVRCKRSTKDRIVYHYQYTDWRDFDVPPSPLPVLKFVEATVTHWSFDHGPIVVHCSAGVGRTGTYICIESLIRQLKTEQQVVIRNFLEHIRQQRMKLVQTEQQYAFIHDALAEYVLYPYHTIRPTHFADYLHHLRELDSSGRSNLEKQYEMCHMTSNSSSTSSQLFSSMSRNWTATGRSGSLAMCGSNDAVGSPIHGYHTLSEYIVTAHPSDGIGEEFWKMVWDENSSILVCLSGTEAPDFWPNKENEVRDIGWLHVTHVGGTGGGGGASGDGVCTRHEFLLTSDREDYALACTLWRLHGWPSLALEHSDELRLANALLDLAASHLDEDQDIDEAVEEEGAMQTVGVTNAVTAVTTTGDASSTTAATTTSLMMTQSQQLQHYYAMPPSGPIVVVDDSGGNRVGVFCALRILNNQFIHDFVFDVYFVFKMLCLQHPRMFQSHLDLEFIYTLLQHYMTRDTRSNGDINNSASANQTAAHSTLDALLGLSGPQSTNNHHRRRRPLRRAKIPHLFPHRTNNKTRLQQTTTAAAAARPRCNGGLVPSTIDSTKDPFALPVGDEHLIQVNEDLTSSSCSVAVIGDACSADVSRRSSVGLPSTGLLESISHESPAASSDRGSIQSDGDLSSSNDCLDHVMQNGSTHSLPPSVV